ncbi:hypothetical protein VP01_2431g2 [Puccinia sorghi]|uniref:DUF4219 domain-containing protein n=1 Tax=Puccinia sorghi TaxID=27349 RepID=A0A0L6V6L3_9BASI|nr:hypothetical protein VP01_2431g2 [Puccinia sorghi]
MAENEGGSPKTKYIPKLDETNFLHWSMRMKAHLRHKGLIKYITEVPVTLSGAAADAGKKKNRRGPYFAPGKHNPEASHDANHCWQVHPELRPNNKPNGSVTHPPTTQLVEVNDGHKSEVSLLLTEAASKPIVLDSGATHHLVNNLDVFLPVAESKIKIATGGHSNFLTATAVGTATLINPATNA